MSVNGRNGKQNMRIPSESEMDFPDSRQIKKADRKMKTAPENTGKAEKTDEREHPGMQKKMFENHRVEKQKQEEKRQIYVNIVIDGSYSFSTIYRTVYRGIQSLIHEVAEVARQYGRKDVCWGLTIVYQQPINVRFGGNVGYYTKDTREFLAALRSVIFMGGSFDGRENINEAMESAIRSLEKESQPQDSRGVLLFTDSMPKETGPEFRNLEDCPNNGLRFAIGYLYDCKYDARLKLVDRDGQIADNDRNEVSEFKSIQELLEPDGISSMREMVTAILTKTSIVK